MDMIPYRLEQVEKRHEAADARLGRIEERLGEIQVTISGLATKDSVEGLRNSLTASLTAGLAEAKDHANANAAATRDSIRNWALSIIAIAIAAEIGVAAIFMQSSSNQLAAFEAGLTAIQGVAAAHQLPAAPAPVKP